MEQKTKTDLSEYIVNIQGRDFITFPGLLAEAHAQGLIAVETQLVNTDLANPIVKATVTMGAPNTPTQVKVFTGYGDANVNNVAKKVAGALLRMSETRAIARALRFATNIDMTALEELGGDGADIPDVPTKATPLKIGKVIGAAVSSKEEAKPVVASGGQATIPPNPEIATNEPAPVVEKRVVPKQVSLNVGRRPATAKLEVQQNNGEPKF